MAIQDDFSVAANGDIRHTSGTTNYTVIAFHRWLGDLMDDAQASGNDILDITDATASERSTDNIITLNSPYNIDDTAAQFLYDGSVIQTNGDTIYDGILVFAAAGMYLSIVQNGVLATNFWTTGLNADAANGISHRFILKVRDTAADIDGRRLIGQTREFGFSYSEFKINGTARGNNVLALTYTSDLNNQTAEGTVAGWTDITNTTEGYKLLDVDNVGGTEPYYSEWNAKGDGSKTINNFYERMKWLTRRGTASALYPTSGGLNGELFRGITHQIDVDTKGGTVDFPVSGEITWPGGVGQMFAIDSISAPTRMWIQLRTGVAPTNNQLITATGADANCLVNTDVNPIVDRTLSFPFIGQSTGSAIIGAYGVGIETADLSASDKLFDLTNTQRIPPNNVTFTVGGLVANEDRVLLGPASGGVLQVGQLTLNTSLSGATETVAVMTASIPSDSPASGTIRIELNSGIYRRVGYASFTGSTFTFDTNGNGAGGTYDFVADPATAPKNVFISYIDALITSGDSLVVTWVYSSDRSLFLRVRDGGTVNNTPIKTFETTGTMGSAGGSSTAIRTSDL
jgi:hypothetical protein